jgi:hypothetical protein
MLLVEGHDPASFPFVVRKIDGYDFVEEVECAGKLRIVEREKADKTRLREEFP